jgi:hypothetical protein
VRRVTYGRERSKTARRATVDISPEFGTTRAGQRSGRAPCCLHNNCRCKELCAIALRHPQMSPFAVSIERRDLIRTTHKLHRLSNIECTGCAKRLGLLAQIQQGRYTEVNYRQRKLPCSSLAQISGGTSRSQTDRFWPIGDRMWSPIGRPYVPQREA